VEFTEFTPPALSGETPARHRFARPQRLAASMAGVASGEAGPVMSCQ